MHNASKDLDQPPNTAQDTKATKAQSKLEKLRKRLEKEEKRIAKAQAKASRIEKRTTVSAEASKSLNAREEPRPVCKLEVVNGIEFSDKTECLPSSFRSEPVMFQDTGGLSAEQDTVGIKKDSTLEAPGFSEVSTIEAATAPNPLTPTSQPSISDLDSAAVPSHLSIGGLERSPEPVEDAFHPSAPPALSENVETEEESSQSTSMSSSDISSSSEDEDETSSSGGSSPDDAPETVTSKRTAPDKVLAPKREKPRSTDICRAFLKNGRCFRGENCKFRHELPEHGRQSRTDKPMKAHEPKKERKGLYQRVSH